MRSYSWRSRSMVLLVAPTIRLQDPNLIQYTSSK